MIAARVAKMVNDLGFWCRECETLVHYHPVNVNWVGLFDECARMKDTGNWPTSVPGNVAHFDHATKTEKATGLKQTALEDLALQWRE